MAGPWLGRGWAVAWTCLCRWGCIGDMAARAHRNGPNGPNGHAGHVSVYISIERPSRTSWKRKVGVTPAEVADWPIGENPSGQWPADGWADGPSDGTGAQARGGGGYAAVPAPGAAGHASPPITCGLCLGR